MKNEYIIVGYIEGNTMPHVFGRNGNFVSWNMPENIKYAKRWTTRAGAERWIVGQQKQGANWGYLVLVVEPSGRSFQASQLGKLGAGKSKTITAEESAARRDRLAAARAKRWSAA